MVSLNVASSLRHLLNPLLLSTESTSMQSFSPCMILFIYDSCPCNSANKMLQLVSFKICNNPTHFFVPLDTYSKQLPTFFWKTSIHRTKSSFQFASAKSTHLIPFISLYGCAGAALRVGLPQPRPNFGCPISYLLFNIKKNNIKSKKNFGLYIKNITLY